MKILKELMKRRLTSPNNATSILCKHLEEIGVTIEGDSKKYAVINGKFYCVTITGAESKYITCRQYDGDGILSLYEKTGQLYLLEGVELDVESVTREMNQTKYRNATSYKEIGDISPMTSIKQVDVNEYKVTYLDVADEVGKELLANVYLKLK